MNTPCRWSPCARLAHGLLVLGILAACSGDGAKRDAIRGTWACKASPPGLGQGADTLSFLADGTYEHIEERGLRYDKQPTHTEWKGSWIIADGVLTLKGTPTFAAREDKDRWHEVKASDEHLSAKIKKVGREGLELETADPYLAGCVFWHTNAPSQRPVIAEVQSGAPPPPKPPAKDCGCEPSDLACAMRCAAP